MLRIADISLTPPPPGWGLTLEGQLIQAGTFHALCSAVWTHQRETGQRLMSDLEIQDCLCKQVAQRYPASTTCDSQEVPFFADIDALPRPPDRDPATFGPAGWRLLHTKRISEEKQPGQWLRAFHSWIPCPRCRNHFGVLIQEVPPIFDCDLAWFECTVLWHGAVNKSLGKREWSIREAQEFYRR